LTPAEIIDDHIYYSCILDEDSDGNPSGAVPTGYDIIRWLADAGYEIVRRPE
jgi:hypothetical protein